MSVSMRGALVAVTCLLVLAPGAAYAQPPVTVADALSFLVTTQAVDTGDAARDRAAAAATSQTLSRALLTSLATLPLTSSSSAFTYRFNPALGTLERASDSFGPFFVERATTAGAGRASFSVNWQYASFDQLEGMRLEDGSLVTTANRFTDEVTPFDVETLRLRIRAHSLTFAGGIGVTDRLDLSAALPIVALSLEGQRTDTYRGVRFQQATATASVVRLADLLVRAKYNLVRGTWGGFSVGGDLRLATGSEEDLVGAGRSEKRGFAVASLGSAQLSSHLTAGFSRGGVSNAVDFGAAVAVNPSARLTVTGEVFGRRLSDLGTIRQVAAPHPSIAGVQTLRLALEPGSTTASQASLGLKWNLSDAWLLSGAVLLPLNRVGLTARLIPTVSLEYNAGR